MVSCPRPLFPAVASLLLSAVLLRTACSVAENQCLVLASDGLWDAMNNDETTRLALEHRRRGPEAAARAIVAEAYNRGSQDNITAVVVFFSYDGPSGSGMSSRASDHNVGMSR
jgi:serine/threonine protein phosphatase PrpC